MAKPNVTASELRDGVSRSASQRHTLVLDQRIIERVEVDDLSFHFNSPILLPAPSDLEGNPDGGALAGLVVIARVLVHAADNASKEVIVAGHTDTVGPPGANATLSERRATNVLRYLQGDREGWIKACAQFQGRDIQQVLRWAHATHGFDCDPQSDSGDVDATTSDARRRFRREHNERFGTDIAIDGPQCDDDWSAFFGLYELSLAKLLGTSVDELASKRAAIKFAKPPLLACGEHWPIDCPGVDAHRSATNRRVEVLFCEPGKLPDQSVTTPPGLDLYGPNPSFRLRTVRLDLPAQIQVLDPTGEPLANITLKVKMADGTIEEHTSDASGKVALPPVPGFRYQVVGLAEAAAERGVIAHGVVGSPLEL